MSNVQLLLNSLRKVGIINNRIKWYFRSKLFIKVGRINRGCLLSAIFTSSRVRTYDRRLERGLNLLLP